MYAFWDTKSCMTTNWVQKIEQSSIYQMSIYRGYRAVTDPNYEALKDVPFHIVACVPNFQPSSGKFKTISVIGNSLDEAMSTLFGIVDKRS